MYPRSGFRSGGTFGDFLRGVTEGGGFHTPVRGTMFVRDGAVTPGPSRECDITFLVKGRPKSARQSRDSTVAARRAQSVTVPSARVSRDCRSPGLRSPPFKNARNMRTYPRSGFLFRGNIHMYPRSSFRSGEHPPNPPFLKTTLL